MRKLFKLFIFCLIQQGAVGQVVLEANGQDNTYELINSVFASPGGDVVEVPDCNHADFGRHIDEVYDAGLRKYVFRFFIHTTPDNDRCINFDRQRNEIKTYSNSPDKLLGIKDEVVIYKWKFKLDVGFQSSSSFTHIHQLKAVDGSEDGMPLITFTTRKGSPDQFELRYAEALSQVTLKKTDLTPFKGEWVEALETVTYGEKGVGNYSVILSKVSDGSELFNYTSDDIRMWKTDASFIRPKWGIYRSLNDSSSLRDEVVLFADFSIQEVDTSIGIDEFDFTHNIIYPNPSYGDIKISNKIVQKYSNYQLYNINGEIIFSGQLTSDIIDVTLLQAGIYFVRFFDNSNGREICKFVKE